MVARPSFLHGRFQELEVALQIRPLALERGEVSLPAGFLHGAGHLA